MNEIEPVIVDLSNEEVLTELFGICNSKEELQEHIKTFLNIDLPNTTLDEDSTSNPMQFVWECYNYMRTGKGPSRHVAASSRNAFKTLSTAILQFYVLNHFRRDSIQISAEVQQSLSAISYVDGFFRMKELKPYSDTDNARKKSISGLPPNSLTGRDEAALKVVTASRKGANSSRGSCFSGKTTIVNWGTEDTRNKTIRMDWLFLRMKKGDVVHTAAVNPMTTQIERKRVVAIQRYEEPNRLVIRTKKKKEIECTLDHPLATGWTAIGLIYTQAERLRVGNTLLVDGDSGIVEFDEVVSIAHYTANPTKRERWVYDIQVEDHHNFFANGILAHNCLIYDEVDLLDRQIIGESAYISDSERVTGFGPLSVYISSRKSASGPVQDLIDEYDNDKPEDLMLHKWSVVDIMKYCPPEVYKEDKPIKAYMHLETLEIHWGEDRFDALVKEGKTAWKEIQSYEGCRTCPAFIACQSRAMKQTTDKPTLRDRFFVGDVLKKVIKTGGPSMVVAQTLNLKPDSNSLIFNMFKTSRHVAQAIDFFKWVAGYYYAPSQIYTPDMIEEIIEGGDPIQIASITPTKADMYAAMRKTGWTFNAGVDWGLYDPAVCVVAGYHKASRRVAFLHVEASSGFPNEDWARYIKANIHNQFPIDLVCPDFGDANSATYFGRLQMVCRDKKPARIETGVAQLRSLMFNPFTQQTHLMILDDGEYGQNSMLIEALQKWSYLKNANGYNYNKFADDEFTHTYEGCRTCPAFIADFNIGYSFNQKVNLSGNLPMQVALGDEETREAAKAAIKEKNRVHNLILNELQSKHGVVGDPFAKAPSAQNPQAGGKSGIKFRF